MINKIIYSFLIFSVLIMFDCSYSVPKIKSSQLVVMTHVSPKKFNFPKTKVSFFKNETLDFFICNLKVVKGDTPYFVTHDSEKKFLAAINKRAATEGIKIVVSDVNDYNGCIQYEKVLTFSSPLRISLIINGKVYISKIESWRLEKSICDCRNATPQGIVYITFPNEADSLYDSDLDNVYCLLYDKNRIEFNFSGLKKFKGENKKIHLDSSTELQVYCIDLNGDGIDDLMHYVENIDFTSSNTYLYVNVEGKWVYKWYEHYEDCI